MIIEHQGHDIDTDKIEQFSCLGHRVKITFIDGSRLECDDPDFRLWERLGQSLDNGGGKLDREAGSDRR